MIDPKPTLVLSEGCNMSQQVKVNQAFDEVHSLKPTVTFCHNGNTWY